MAQYMYEPLSAQDHSFLVMETSSLHMHVASTQLFELGPLATAEGGVDFARIKRFIGSVLHRIPRYRQKLHFVPIFETPVWVDDDEFSLDFHVRHTALPKPGSDKQLRQLAARIMAQPLDRTRPLWEIWVVEGLSEGRFALVSKIHHCMIDGSSGVDISQILQSRTPERRIGQAPPFVARPTPGPGELFGYALRWRAGLPLRALRGLREFRRETEDAWGELRLRARVLARMFLEQYGRASESPINGPIGPHRTFGWVDMDLAELRAARRGFGCTLNDLVLCIVTGAFRDYLRLRGVRPEDLEFRIQAPVSVRSEDERGRLGNRVSGWVVTLPLGEEDPRLQLAEIQETTRDLKESKQALGVEMMMAAMGEMPTALLSLGMQAASGTINSIVTNVPGPQFPLYLQGARMLALYPQVPLLQSLGLGIALISYDGKVCWGFNADPKLVPDLEVFVAAIRSSQARVLALARPEPASEPLTAPHEAAPSRSGGSAPPARSG
jgi:diacylglycerol O-acyltransferase / wax synthase